MKGLEIATCPECGAIAEIVDEFDLDSTDGPVRHQVTRCLAGHVRTRLPNDTWLTPRRGHREDIR